MKEIKFRLIDEKNKIVGYEKWCSGHFNMETKKDYYVIKPCWLYTKKDGLNDFFSDKFIEHRFKNQFTGLQDRNGIDIYDGDIIEYAAYDELSEEIFSENGVIIYEDGCFLVDWLVIRKCDPTPLFELESSELKVIGNVHENPEILTRT